MNLLTDEALQERLAIRAASHAAACVLACSGLDAKTLNELEPGQLAALYRKHQPVRDALAEAIRCGTLKGVGQECCGNPSNGSHGFECCGTPTDLHERAVLALNLEE